VGLVQVPAERAVHDPLQADDLEGEGEQPRRQRGNQALESQRA
jgi:hypothetical protein